MRKKDIANNIDYNLLNRNDKTIIKINIQEITDHNSSSIPHSFLC